MSVAWALSSCLEINENLSSLCLDIHVPGLLDEQGGHLLGGISIGQVGAGSDAEVAAATSSGGVGPLEGAHVGVHVVGGLELVLGIDAVVGGHGQRFCAQVVGRGDLDVARAISPLEGAGLVVGLVKVAA